MSAVGLDEPPGVAAAAAADEDAEAASAADSISVAEEEPGGMELVTDGSNGMHQPTVNLDITDAAISQEIQPDVAPGVNGTRPKDAPCIVLPHQNDYVSHIALDIGGSLIKLIYFSMDDHADAAAAAEGSNGPRHPTRGGKLHFVKFETAKVHECIAFIEAKGLHLSRDGSGGKMRVKATGGGAYKFAELFKERLGLIIEGEDEMACMVEGCNFLLNAVRHEAFQYENGQMKFVDLPSAEHYPYLLVSIGSGVSMVRVDGENKFTRVSGTNIGGGTFWGLCKLLTGMDNFDDILSLSSLGDNSNVDMLVGDIYGGRDYTGIGLSANTIASSFGKIINQNKDLEEYNPADMVQSLCRMISYNIGQLAYLNAKRYNLSRIFFGGFFIRGHPYTMETISFAIRFWSKGEMAAMFLRHEGFLGAVGAFMKVQALQGPRDRDARKVRARFVERFSMGAPVMGGEVRGPAITGLPDKISWVEKFVEVGRPASEAAKREHERALEQQRRTTAPTDVSDALAAAAAAAAQRQQQRINFHVGVLHYTPSSEPFPLLDDAVEYNPSTIDINGDPAEMAYWIGILQDQIPQVVEKAAVSEGGTAEAQRRAAACGKALDLHLTRLREKPGAYGQLGLADLFELREECLREFGFQDVYRKDKERENGAALEVLPDLLTELDALAPPQRLLALVQGVLAANIFDWGAKACVDLYQSATILEMYREARTRLSQRPWRVDDFDAFAEVWFSKSQLDSDGQGKVVSPYQRAIMFVDNAGADVVLGMIPFARELLRMGAEVVLVANSLPAINDVTVAELRSVVAKAAEACPIIRAARDAAVAAEAANHGRIPPVPGSGELTPPAGEESGPSGSNGGEAGGTSWRQQRQLCGHRRRSPSQRGRRQKGMFGESYPSPWRDPRLFIAASGHGSPCLDLRRLSSEVADAAAGTDLVVIEGMGRAIHTNYYTRLQCDTLKLAMIKNKHLAQSLFRGDVYDCVCRFDEGMDT
ncbi:hypothetical protein COHA_002181 [Chlorella ohadii]|uniref:pantothenate kinase n=1 Tax=Chlorella ohadii TaxID=2649997 RepID=A0AAD5H7V6_9CHLO|nr:hypothetical protein COHA_002181 [Chlorella ohadii]